MWGLIVRSIILGLKYNLNFLKCSFITWRLFFDSEGSSGEIFWEHFSLGIKFFKGAFSSGVSYNQLFLNNFLQRNNKKLDLYGCILLTLNLRKAFLQYASLQAFLQATLLQAAPGWKGQKIKQMVSNTLRLNFWPPQIIRILHSRYNLTITGHILKNKQKNKHVCINEIMELIIMKMKTKIKINSRR